MNADRTLWIGKDHTICEDYAIAHTGKDFAYAMVCDGCSASPDVDIGARLLALSAKTCYDPFWFKNNDPIDFGQRIINHAGKVFNLFPKLHSQSLDATLLWASVTDIVTNDIRNLQLNAFVYGDGVVVHKNKFRTDLIHIQLSSGAPDYLSYHLDEDRMNAYKNGFKDSKKEVWTNYDGVHDYDPFVPFVLQRSVEEGDVIAVISDGINSFRKADYTPIPWQDLVEEFTGFKNFEGEFVQRRIAAFKRKCLKEGTMHSDDISVAAIVV